MFHIRGLKEFFNLNSRQKCILVKYALSHIIYYVHVSVAIATIIRVPSQEYR
jgi:hypothetical protein